MSNVQNFTVDAGTTFQVTVLYKDASDVAINITGYSAVMQVRKNSSTEPVASVSESDGISITGASGRLDVTIPATTPAGNYVYALDITAPGGITTRLLKGSFFDYRGSDRLIWLRQ